MKSSNNFIPIGNFPTQPRVSAAQCAITQRRPGITSRWSESCSQRTKQVQAEGTLRAMSQQTHCSHDRLDWDNLAADALELARLLPPGPERNDALKLATQLRCTADARGLVFAKPARPRKQMPAPARRVDVVPDPGAAFAVIASSAAT